jgi:hypothetical protein
LVPMDERAGFVSLDEFRRLASQLFTEVKNRGRLAQYATHGVGAKAARLMQQLIITGCFTLQPPMRSQVSPLWYHVRFLVLNRAVVYTGMERHQDG